MNYIFTAALINASYSFFKENYFYRASALAFTTILAMVPLFVVIVFFITFFPIFGDLISLSENYLLEYFVPSASLTIKNYFALFIQQATAMPVGSVLFLLITAIMLINMVEGTLNTVWKVNRRRKNLAALLFYWLVILLTPLIIGMSIFISSSILNLYWVTRITELFQLKLLIDFLLPILINTILFSLLYIIAPNVRVIWRYGLLGGFVAAVIFNFTRVSFVWYIEKFQSYSVIYGVFAIIPIFMIWLYIAWVIIIWGAMFTYHLQLGMKNRGDSNAVMLDSKPG